MTYAGAYDSATPYNIGNAVFCASTCSGNGSTWVSLINSNKGNDPPTSSSAWGEVAAVGATGINGATGPKGATGATGATGPAGSSGSGSSPSGIPYAVAGHTGAAAWNSPASGIQQVSLNAEVTIVLPTTCTPSMTIYSWNGNSVNWNLYEVTPSTSSVTWTLGSSVINCTTSGNTTAAQTCTASAAAPYPAGTVLTLGDSADTAPGGGGFIDAFSCQ
jgi:hypothetical protein